MSEHAMVPLDFIKPTLRSLMPDEIVYPANGLEMDVILYNKDNYELFLYGAFELDKTDHNPKSLMGRVGIMRVFNLAPGNPDVLLDGYIASLRFYKDPIEPSYYTDEPPGDVEEEEDWRQEQADRIPLLAVESRGPKGRSEFIGNELARPAMKHLSREMNLLHHRRNQQMINRKARKDKEDAKSKKEKSSQSSK